MRRQLHFQLAFFENAVDKTFTSTSDAFQAAYAQVYTKYHGKAIKRIFNYSLGGAPEITEVYKCMNPAKLKQVESTGGEDFAGDEPNENEALQLRIASEMEKDAHSHMQSFLGVSKPILGDLAALFEELNMNDPKVV